MATRDDMVTRIVREMGGRTDLNTSGAIVDAINTAITAYQGERFRFNETRPLTPFQFNTVAGQPFYDSATDSRIATIQKIDWINYAIGSTLEKLEQVTPEEIYLALQSPPTTQQGNPLSWAYDGQSIILYPCPDRAYTLTVGGHLFAAAPVTGTEVGNPWMNEAELLIRSRAKYELAVHQTRNPLMQAAMSPEEDGNAGKPGATWLAWSDLKSETNKITGRGKVRPMQF